MSHTSAQDIDEEIDIDEDPFHESDVDHSDFVPETDSDLNTTTQEMAQDIESNVSNWDFTEIDETQLFELPTTSAVKNKNRRNKNLGKEYVTNKKKIVPAKKIKALSKCRRLCNTHLNFEEQKMIFILYWNLGDYNKRRQYLSGLIDVEFKKTHTINNVGNRQYNYLYNCEINGQRRRVCKQCFMKIYAETAQSIKTVTKCKVKESSVEIVQCDKRGKHFPEHKLSTEKYQEVLDHINSFPKYVSHYSRRHTKQLYLQCNLSMAELYRLYTNKFSQPVSLSTYREIFQKLDIKFKKPHIDVCNKCETLRIDIKNALTEDEIAMNILKQQNHHDEADMAYESKKHDKELSSKDKSIKMYTFDLQQCLPTPHLNAAMFFYKRPLWTFNFTMHDGATNRANCYIWNETIAKRGANEISSCIFKCIMELPIHVKHVILYSDSCPGQNRNSYICAMFEKVLEDHQTIELIDHKFLVVGHTHMECDTVHSQIEKKKKKCVNSIHHPHDWATLIATTNHKYIAIEMVQDQYFDFGSLLKNKYTWRNTNTLGACNTTYVYIFLV